MYDGGGSELRWQSVSVWRTSTPEPTIGDGIIWTYLKDVTRYIPLFAKPGTFILELDNLLETGLDGQYASESLASVEVVCVLSGANVFVGLHLIGV